MPSLDERVPEYQRTDELESLLKFFAARLGPVEQREIAEMPLCDEPIVYVMGCGRIWARNCKKCCTTAIFAMKLAVQSEQRLNRNSAKLGGPSPRTSSGTSGGGFFSLVRLNS